LKQFWCRNLAIEKVKKGARTGLFHCQLGLGI
jgi:hypothetical protein